MRRHPRRASVDPSAPQAWGTSDRSGMVGTHAKMQWQYEWSGFRLVSKGILVHPDELDQPNRQLGSQIIPPDPLPIYNARPEQYFIDEQTFLLSQSKQMLMSQDGHALLGSNLQGAVNAGGGTG